MSSLPANPYFNKNRIFPLKMPDVTEIPSKYRDHWVSGIANFGTARRSYFNYIRNVKTHLENYSFYERKELLKRMKTYFEKALFDFQILGSPKLKLHRNYIIQVLCNVNTEIGILEEEIKIEKEREAETEVETEEEIEDDKPNDFNELNELNELDFYKRQ
tara:strand:+ start:463 stop:942 length:480 start_codon:yes stop_codon:yes gene_type:complete